MTSDYVLESEDLVDDSESLLTAVRVVLKKHRHVKENHPAFKSKVLVEEGVDTLQYASKTMREKWFRRNYHRENMKLRRLQDELERRLRLFLMVV
jgi:hypothetical protein